MNRHHDLIAQARADGWSRADLAWLEAGLAEARTAGREHAAREAEARESRRRVWEEMAKTPEGRQAVEQALSGEIGYITPGDEVAVPGRLDKEERHALEQVARILGDQAIARGEDPPYRAIPLPAAGEHFDILDRAGKTLPTEAIELLDQLAPLALDDADRAELTTTKVDVRDVSPEAGKPNIVLAKGGLDPAQAYAGRVWLQCTAPRGKHDRRPCGKWRWVERATTEPTCSEACKKRLQRLGPAASYHRIAVSR